MRLTLVVTLSGVLCGASAWTEGHRQKHVFVEESNRLPLDTSLPGTSSTDVDLVDVEGDGDLDLFIAEGTDSIAARPNRLLINDGHGVFTDQTARRFPVTTDSSRGGGLADLDDDGDLDLDVYVPNAGAFTVGHGFGGGQDRYFRNNGKGKFRERTARHFPRVLDPTTDAAFGDIDGDGDLDLAVGNSGENGGERVFVQRN